MSRVVCDHFRKGWGRQRPYSMAGRSFGVPHSFLITVALVAIAWVYLRHTAGGRHFYAIGGDQVAAQLAGVKVRKRV
ncbi:MAG: ABC transporter permease subunit, partial [Propionibacteriaceae bacterium]